MISKLKRIFTDIQLVSQYYLRTKNRFNYKKGHSIALINADTSFLVNDLGRYAHVLSQVLTDAGYKVVIKADKAYFKKQKRYNKLMWGKGYTFIRKSNGPKNTLSLIDKNKGAKFIHLGYQQFYTPHDPASCGAPYPMHPFVYDSYPENEKLLELRSASRTMSIFFAGNINPHLYDKGKVNDRYQLIPRNSLLALVKQMFPKAGVVHQVTEKPVLENLIEGLNGKAAIVLSAARTENFKWLSVLSKADFFLCPPGVGMPWCHNLTEAMSVGTIPILQYDKYVVPKLKHEHNCLSFNDAAEFEEVINKALRMQPEEINRIRANVLSYYDTNLSPQAVIKRIKAFAASNRETVTLALPFVQS